MAQHLLQHQATAGLQITDKLGNDPLNIKSRVTNRILKKKKRKKTNQILIIISSVF
jgi:hypothetical protein